MKRILKASSLVLLGFVLCFGVMVGISIHRAQRSIGLMDDPDEIPSKREADTKREVQRLFSQGDVEGLNQILAIREGELELTINGPDTFPSTHTPLAELVIVNRSSRNLTIFDPRIVRLTEPSYDYKGYLQDDISLSFLVGLRARCHVLAPGQMFSIPVFFRVTGAGRHKINLSAGFPACKELKADSRKFDFPVVAHAHYIFEIGQIEQKVPNQPSQSTTPAVTPPAGQEARQP
jgi:hypothetical protein